MEKQFVPYELAVKLKELGFDELCLGWYAKNDSVRIANGVFVGNHGSYSYELGCYTPLWQQAFDWFRDKHNFSGIPQDLYNGWYCFTITMLDYTPKNNMQWVGERKIFTEFETYQEARHACLEKLIELVKGA